METNGYFDIYIEDDYNIQPEIRELVRDKLLPYQIPSLNYLSSIPTEEFIESYKKLNEYMIVCYDYEAYNQYIIGKIVKYNMNKNRTFVTILSCIPYNNKMILELYYVPIKNIIGLVRDDDYNRKFGYSYNRIHVANYVNYCLKHYEYESKLILSKINIEKIYKTTVPFDEVVIDKD